MQQSRVVSKAKAVLNEASLTQTQRVPLRRSAWVVAAVSGGPDSLALLHLLANRDLHCRNRIVVAHINHGLRLEADEDAALVASIAAEWDLEYREIRHDVAVRAGELGLTIEEAGRKVRFDFYSSVAEEFEACYIITGHNSDDQTETILMHLLRGSGLGGLRGMKAIDPFPDSSDLYLLRPLIEVSSKEIQGYCHDNGLAPAIDATNQDTQYDRNWIRQELIPLIEDRYQGFGSRVRQFSEIAEADLDYIFQSAEAAYNTVIEERSDEWLRWDLVQWRHLPLSLKRWTIRLAWGRFAKNTSELGFPAVEAVRWVGESGHVGQTVDLPGNIRMTVEYSTILFALAGSEPPIDDAPQMASKEPIKLMVPGIANLSAGWRIECEVLTDCDLFEIMENPDPFVAYVDAGELDKITIRPPKEGERFQPLGMGGQSGRLSDVMINRKIPAHLRTLWPMVVNENNFIWLIGYQIDERAKVTESTGKVLRLVVRRHGSV